MITRFRLTFAALFIGSAILSAGAAAAADLRLPAAPPPQVASAALLSWAGPYFGVQAGYLSGRSDISLPATGEFHFVDPKGAIVGATAGFSAQWGRIVAGLEGDVNFVDARATIDTGFAPTPAVTQLQSAVNWNSHLRGRIGYAFDRTLLFAAGGLAVAGVESKAFDNGIGTVASWSDTRIGWSIGAGGEFRFAPQASVRLEYLYDNYGSKTLAAQTVGATTFGARESRLDTHTVRAGVYWRF
ncbi:outer membrane protein [Bradyrhizobium yuanmingense]|uniref:outer membrane protein n=1 Tax=Bradyrhizobium yuanmingense TaxID=108015 RepID=UPI0012F9156B|nr:outer membrane beta-barrel protein [Bradyrhizobium yuanmingense]